MTYEEMQRTMQFILEQQAQFTADIQKLQEGQRQLQESQTRLQESQAETNQLLTRLAAVTVRGFEDTNAKINALVDAQMMTDGTVRSLAAVVDRYFNEGKNGA